MVKFKSKVPKPWTDEAGVSKVRTEDREGMNDKGLDLLQISQDIDDRENT